MPQTDSSSNPSLFKQTKETINYLDEDELKAEVKRVQNTQYLRYLYEEKNWYNENIDTLYKWEQKALKDILSEISELENDGYSKDYSLDKFGEMVLLLLNRLLSSSNFSGYSYKSDMISDAVDKIFRYLHNFDETMISKITGKKVKVFAYLTQIARMSFIHIINVNKAENEMIKSLIPTSTYDPSVDMSKITKFYRDNNKSTHHKEIIEFDIDIDIHLQETIPIIFEDKSYNSVYDLVNEKYTGDESIKVLLHNDIVISLDEYEQIINLGIDTLNITRFVHKNSFPKKQKTKKNLEELWSEEFGISLDSEFCIDRSEGGKNVK